MSVNTRDYSEYAPYPNGQEPEFKPEEEKFQEEELSERDIRRRASVAEGQIKHKKLGWKRLTVRLMFSSSL